MAFELLLSVLKRNNGKEKFKAKYPKIDFDQLKKYLEEQASKYFNDGKSDLTDEDYDFLLKFYESETGDIMPIGAPVNAGKKEVSVSHSFENLTGSLSKVQDLKGLKEWLRLLDIQDKDELEIVLSLKFDGNSCMIEYKNGQAIESLTRGRDGKGASLMHLFQGHKIKEKEHCGIQYEILMTYKNFDRLNSTIEKEKDKYLNPRAAVAGLTSKLDGIDFIEYLNLVPLRIIYKDGEVSRRKELKKIKSIFYDDDKLVRKVRITQTCKKVKGNYKEIYSKIRDFYLAYTELRYELNYMIDGIVLEFCNKSIKKLGYVSSKPKWAIAIKFPHQEKETEVTGIEFDFGASMRCTPCATFKPVKFNGTTHKRVSLQNYKRFKELRLGIGTKVIIQYRNDTLSYLQLKDCPENKDIKRIKLIKKCPECNEKIKINKKKTFCSCVNKNCPGLQRGKILKYITTLDIYGIEENTIAALVNNKIIKSVPDLYSMNPSKIAKLEGFGKKSAENIINSIKAKVPFDYELLAGMGIEGIGREFCKVVLAKYPLVELIEHCQELESEILDLQGFSDIRFEKLYKGIKENKDTLLKLTSIITYNKYSETIIKKGNAMSYKFVITGDTINWTNREVLKKWLETRGHKIVGSISKNTDYLITNDTTTGTIKNQKAKELGVPIIDEKQLLELLKEKL